MAVSLTRDFTVSEAAGLKIHGFFRGGAEASVTLDAKAGLTQ